MNELNKWVEKAMRSEWPNILFFVGIGLTLFELWIMETTVMSGYFPFAVWIIGGLCAMPFTKDFLKDYPFAPKLFYKIVYHICAFGGILSFAVIALNRIPIASAEKVIVPISNTYYYQQKAVPVPHAVFYIDGVKLNLEFDTSIKIENYSSLQLTLRRGLFGFKNITEAIPVSPQQKKS